jgi:two-component system response regulator RegX3
MSEQAGGPILLVEDEPTVAETVRYSLEREGFRVVLAPDGNKGVERFRNTQPSLIILDLMLPGMPGLDVCRLIRGESNVPIIMLTAKDSEADKVTGLELGADDYVTKPFSMRELVSRVRALLRRAGMEETLDGRGILEGGSVSLDSDRHEVSVRGDAVRFTPKEFALLELLLERKGRLLTRDYLLEEVWGPGYVGDTKTLDVHIKRLREKVEEDPHQPRHIVTIRGLGYKYVESGSGL